MTFWTVQKMKKDFQLVYLGRVKADNFSEALMKAMHKFNMKSHRNQKQIRLMKEIEK